MSIDADNPSAVGPAKELVAHVDVPRAQRVRSHTHQFARFAGWIATRRGRSLAVHVRVDGEHRRTVAADRPRPDVVDTLGVEAAGGFDFYLELPDVPRRLAVDLTMTDGAAEHTTATYWLEPDIDLALLDTYEGQPWELKRLARRYLSGEGLEFGALHQRLEVDPRRARMRYADRHRRDEALAIFDELREPFGDRLVEVDWVLDLDRDDLSALENEQFDFFVANGVIEHLVNPVRFLENLHRIMKPGARFFLAAPDRDYTFDTVRELTPLPHFFDEFERGERDLSDEHLRDALFAGNANLPMPDEAALQAFFEWHRQRSIHVHVWDQCSFDAFLERAIERAAPSLAIIDRATSRQAVGNCVYVLEKRIR